MAWIAPSTRADGFVVTAAVWNQDVVANTIANRAQIRGSVSGGYVSRSGANLVYAPDTCNVCFCFESGVWNLKVIPDAGVTVGATGLTASTAYYLYVYDAGGGAMTLDLSTTGTVLQNGIRVKSGATERTFVAYIYADSAGAVTTYAEDAATQLICNAYNQRRISLYKTDAGANWTYTSGVWRSANNSTTNRLHAVSDGRGSLEVQVEAIVNASGASAVVPAAGVGVNSTAVPSGSSGTANFWVASLNGQGRMYARYEAVPAVGYNYYQWLEYGTANVTFYGTTTAFGPTVQSRISAVGMF
jgi:hypothetical protein